MTKPVIVTRAVKGAPLTRTELDNNFSNLDNATIKVAGDSGTITGVLNDTFNINGGNGIGTAVQSGNLVVNLNGVYGGDSTSSTTVGNNTAVLLAPVATSGSYTDLTNKPTNTSGTITAYNEGIPYSLTYSSTITPDCANGNNQKITLTDNVIFSAFANPVAGQSLTLFVTQDSTGSRTLTSTMKFAGGSNTLSTTANATDILVVFYDGSTYWASLSKDFK
jgi:hypothetical protein